MTSQTLHGGALCSPSQSDTKFCSTDFRFGAGGGAGIIQCQNPHLGDRTCLANSSTVCFGFKDLGRSTRAFNELK